MRYVILGDHETELESFDSYQAAGRWIAGYTRDASGWESISIYENANDGQDLVFEFYTGDVDAG